MARSAAPVEQRLDRVVQLLEAPGQHGDVGSFLRRLGAHVGGVAGQEGRRLIEDLLRRMTCSLYSASRLSMASRRTFRRRYPAASPRPRSGDARSRAAQQTPQERGPPHRGRGGGGQRQVKSARRSCAQVGSLCRERQEIPAADRDTTAVDAQRTGSACTDWARRSDSAMCTRRCHADRRGPTIVTRFGTCLGSRVSRTTRRGVGRQRRLVETKYTLPEGALDRWRRLRFPSRRRRRRSPRSGAFVVLGTMFLGVTDNPSTLGPGRTAVSANRPCAVGDAILDRTGTGDLF